MASALVRLPPLPPSTEHLRRVERTWALLRPLLGLVTSHWQALEVRGAEHCPRSGPALLLSNHVGILDPLCLMLALGRPVQFMAGEGLFDAPGAGRLARWSGAVPRKKMVADLQSVRQLLAWGRVGGLIGLFPEADRTWDGQTQALVPGIGRLVRTAGLPVLVARLVGVYHQHPRWAARQRRGPVRVELDPPRSFTRQDDPEQIEASLQEALTVDPLERPAGRLRGKELALGLPDALFECPRCGATDRLRAKGDALSCAACRAQWGLDLEHRLSPRGGGEALRVPELLSSLRRRAEGRHLEAGPGEPLLRSARARVLDISEARARPLGEGPVELWPEGLRLPGEPLLPMAELRTFNVYMRRRLQIRAAARSFELVLPPEESALRWQWIGEPARRALG